MLNTTIDTSDTRVHYVMYIYYVCVCVFFFLEIMEVKKIRESNDEVLLLNLDVC